MKIIENYEDHTLGFPVTIERAVFKAHGNDWYLDINSRHYQDAVFDLLLDKLIQLNGAQIAFIRKYMELTQGQFAALLSLETHGRISQWEKSGQEVPDIRPVYLQALKVQMAKFRNRELSIRFLSDVLAGRLEKMPLVIAA
jgi:DNA-binding transcriptional regulator YiaG